MSKRYIFLAFVLLAAAFGLTRLTPPGDQKQVDPDKMLIRLNDPSRFQSTHLIAKRLIERDPCLMLIDVRNTEQFEEYHIPGAVNIPLEEILDPNWVDYIDQDAMDVVFYSNADIYSDQAWMLNAQQGVKNIYIMKGGVNAWFASIIQPQPPLESAPSEDFEKYSFEVAASIYFGGRSAGIATAAPPKRTVQVVKKEKKAAEGGC